MKLLNVALGAVVFTRRLFWERLLADAAFVSSRPTRDETFQKKATNSPLHCFYPSYYYQLYILHPRFHVYYMQFYAEHFSRHERRRTNAALSSGYLGERALLGQRALVGLSEQLFEGVPHRVVAPLLRRQLLESREAGDAGGGGKKKNRLLHAHSIASSS